MDELDDFARAITEDLQSRIPGFEKLAQRSKDIVLRAGRQIGAVTFRAMAGQSRPEDPALATEAEASLENIKVAGVIRFQDAFMQSAANVIKQGWETLKKVLPLPLP